MLLLQLATHIVAPLVPDQKTRAVPFVMGADELHLDIYDLGLRRIKTSCLGYNLLEGPQDLL